MTMRLRGGTVADVENFARLVNEYHQQLRGEDLWQIDELASLLVSPSSDPVRFDRYVEVDGVVVGGLHTHSSAPYRKATLYLACPLSPNRLSYVRQLLEAGMRVLRGRTEIPANATVQIDIPAEDSELHDLVRAMGFARANQVAIMEAELAHTAEPEWPGGYHYAEFSGGSDLRAGFAIVKTAFAGLPAWWHVEERDFVYMMRHDPTALPGLSLVALRHEEAAGIAVNFEDTTRAQTGLIGLFAVMPHMQGQGVGKALLEQSFQQFRKMGWTHARLATIYGYRKAEPSVYRAVGMRAVHFNETFLRTLD
jgi:GNAT superfamily N-acetyltransferase